jgi:orotate phosphoribosyltransferase
LLKDRLIEAQVVRTNRIFRTTSGKKSGYYIDVKNVLANNPAILAETVGIICEHISSIKIAAKELGAVPLLSPITTKLFSLGRSVPYIILRKEESSHGLESRIIGSVRTNEEAADPARVVTVTVIEDVVNTGGTLLELTKYLRSSGAEVSKAVCVVDREEGGYELLKKEGVELISLVKGSELPIPRR